MPVPILITKLHIPLFKPKTVLRSTLIERLNDGLRQGSKLTLISAPAGFGKTTLIRSWISGWQATAMDQEESAGSKSKPVNQVAWLSLDEEDNESKRFLSYVIAALQTLKANIGNDVLEMLQTPQPPSTELLLTSLINEIS